jgi:hypothetical protein
MTAPGTLAEFIMSEADEHRRPDGIVDIDATITALRFILKDWPLQHQQEKLLEIILDRAELQAFDRWLASGERVFHVDEDLYHEAHMGAAAPKNWLKRIRRKTS